MNAVVINPYKTFSSPEIANHWQSWSLEDINSNHFQNRNWVVLPVPQQKVVCGLFGIHDDYIEKFQSLDSRFIKNKASTYFFEATSDSMEPLIFAGDVLIVDRSIEPSHLKVAVFSYEGELICKRLFHFGAKSFLKSDNSKYKDIELSEDSDLSVFGTVIGIVREI